MFDKIIAHTSFIGETGYSNHSRSFFTALNKLVPVKVRNYTVGKTWSGLNNGEPHNNESYLTEEHKDMLYKQTCIDNGKREDHYIYGGSSDDEKGNVLHIILNEVNHYYFYDEYNGPKIAYNVWESTLYPEDFYKKLLEFDQLWVPTKWQRDCVIKQGYISDKVKVVPEAVDGSIFFPENIKEENKLEEYKDGRFKFLLFGRWDYRKSTKEIIDTFLKTFHKDEPVDLVVSIDNPFSCDGMLTTEDRLKYYGFEDERIKIKHFPSREDYIRYLKTGHVFLSCARSEGWNLPLCESLSCGIPSIYSNWGGQLEFAEGKGLPVSIIGEKKANEGKDFGFNGDVPGSYCDPDFNHLSVVMRESYSNHKNYKEKAYKESKDIRNAFSWGEIAKDAYNICDNLNKNTKYILIDGKTLFYEDDNFLPLLKSDMRKKIYEKYFKVKEGDIVVDIGAHIGSFSLSITDRDIKKCYCIEPYELNYKLLRKNISYSGCFDKFSFIKKAISKQTGDALFSKPVFCSSDQNGETQVSTISFMDFINENNIDYIDFLKMDCEGGEYDIINNEENWDFLKNKVAKIAGEIHLRGDKKNSLVLINNLKKLGFFVSLESIDGTNINNYFYDNIDYYNEILFYAQKEREKYTSISFITAGNKEYSLFSSECIKQLERYSHRTRKHFYAFNFDNKDNDIFLGEDVRNLKVDRMKSLSNLCDNTFHFAKIRACIDAIETIDSDYYVWIDSDANALENIDNIFNYLGLLQNYPLCPIYFDENIFQWREINGIKKTSFYGDEVSKEMGIKRDNNFIVCANLFIFNKNCKDFFQEVISLGEELRQKNIDDFFVDDNAFSEERIFNCLFWKYGYKNHLPITWVSKGWESNKKYRLYFNNSILNDIIGYDYDLMFKYNDINSLNIRREDVILFHSKPFQKDIVLTSKLLERYNSLYRDPSNNTKEIVKEAFGIGMMQIEKEIEDFVDFLKNKKIKNVLEIGTDRGGSFYLWNKISDRDGKKITIDIPHGNFGRNDFDENERNNKIMSWSENIHIINGDSHDELSFYKIKNILKGDEIDLLFIDGDHTYEGVKKDYEMYKCMVKEGGIIAFHDINKGGTESAEVYKLWDEIKGEKIEFNDNKESFGIGVIEKIKKEVFLIACYPDSQYKIEMLNEQIDNLKKYNIPICITSHYPIPKYIQAKVDYSIVDLKNNILLETPMKYLYDCDDFVIEGIPINVKYPHIALLHLLKNSLSILKKRYDIVHYIESDTLINIDKYFNEIKNCKNKKIIVFNYENKDSMNTLLFSGDICFLDSSIPYIYTQKEYNRIGEKSFQYMGIYYNCIYEYWLYNVLLSNVDNFENIKVLQNNIRDEIISPENRSQFGEKYKNIILFLSENEGKKILTIVSLDKKKTTKIKIYSDDIVYIDSYISPMGSYLLSFYDNKKFSIEIDREWIEDIDIKNKPYSKITFSDKNNIDNKKYLISLDSKSLGDSIAWIPYAEEFRIKNNCKVVLSTFWNNLFEKEYPEIEFVKPGSVVHNIQKQYNIGWYLPWDSNKNPNDFRIIPLQQTASDILGLDFKEIKPNITINKKDRKIKEKYVCIGIHSTCQAKYWNYPYGWKWITSYLKNKGYRVFNISKEGEDYMGNVSPEEAINIRDMHIDDTINMLYNSDMFIGIGSGLSWLSWAIGTPTILISGFSNPICEPQKGIERVFNPNVCNSCFNDPNIEFDKGDWNWCPRKKDFECSKKITPEMVIEKINKILNIN